MKYNHNYIVLFLLLLSGIHSVAQKKNTFVKPGLYGGGFCADERLCGYWWLKADKSFVLISGENGIIKSAGAGTWSVDKDSMITFKFKSIPDNRFLNNSNVKYECTTKHSIDSIYIEGNIKGEDGRSVAFAIVGIAGTKQKLTQSDKNGNFKLVIPASEGFRKLQVNKMLMGYLPLTVNANENYNFHTFSIVLPLRGDSSFIPIEEGNVKVKYTLNRTLARQAPTIVLITIFDKKDELFKLIEDAQKNQPYFKNYFQMLIDLIKK